ncbi:mitochondrial fission ELM1 family protein [uncultured Algimonas sp.]|uniref:mitochondrial fission ELM1 family protein n=1 Tax=uncultured Algimonas sp. TaxID=1547920 RepID=UPI00261D754B|nr:mitochondrial fission ELM1 family protein [uncultured Algimonas sp.]
MKLLVASDGRRGIENQALGLAEAICRQVGTDCRIATHILASGPAFAALPPWIQLAVKRDFGLPPADIIIGCGRQAIAALLSVRRKGRCDFTVYVQDPRTEPSRFDLVVAPKHDGLSGPSVETMIGSPNRVTRDLIIAETLAHADRLSTLPMPRAMIAIGGPSHTHDMDAATTDAHLKAARNLADGGYSLLITTSRRTPDLVQDQWRAFANGRPNDVWLHTPDAAGHNPYFAFLGGAKIILVSEDSTNMLTEACTTGKPVYRLPMQGDPGKFADLYEVLRHRCGVRRWDGRIDDPDYAPLDETARIADRVLERYRNR